jgi:8-oxo-dGTP diphosphatase
MKTLIVAAALIAQGKRILLAQREAGDDWGLRWEFPGGTLEDDEGPRECIRRELREELGVEVEVGDIYHVTFQRYECFNVLLLLYQCSITRGVPAAIACREVSWIGKEELVDLPMPPADEEIRERILKEDLWDLGAV